VIDLARTCGFGLMNTIETYEVNNTENAIYIWGRM